MPHSIGKSSELERAISLICVEQYAQASIYAYTYTHKCQYKSNQMHGELLFSVDWMSSTDTDMHIYVYNIHS